MKFETIIMLAGFAITLIGAIYAGITWYNKQIQTKQETKQRNEQQDSDIARLKDENCLIVYALSACLDGLEQLGANHTVPKAKNELDKYINKQAHK